MTFLPEGFLSGDATSKNGHLLVAKVKELSQQRWGKETLLLGNHPSFLKALHKLGQYAPSEAPVLITGESGVGKELFARALYLLSQNGAAYVPVNCGQFSDDNLMVSELFGHTKGSFTGAAHDRQGVFEAANGGAIFLDEIGELSLNAQTKLLRVIDQKEIMPLGAKKVRRIDIRVISATHRNLAGMVDFGKFREDLLHRLNCLHIHVPALHERGDDCALLLNHYLGELNAAHGIQKQFAMPAMRFLEAYAFPGNIRELKNIVETGFRDSNGQTIELEDMTEKLQNRRRNDLRLEDISEYYNRMADQGESFWEVIHQPFLQHDLSRGQVKAIIQKGLQKTGSYKSLMKLFNIPEKDSKKFLNFLQHNDLKP